MLGKIPTYGYAPVRVEMNNATKIDREITLNFTSTDDSYGVSVSDQGNSKTTSDFSFVCNKGSRETVDFLVPLTTIFQSSSSDSGTALQVSVKCSGYPTTSGNMYTEVNESWPSIVMSNSLYVPNASTLNGHVSKTHFLERRPRICRRFRSQKNAHRLAWLHRPGCHSHDQ